MSQKSDNNLHDRLHQLEQQLVVTRNELEEARVAQQRMMDVKQALAEVELALSTPTPDAKGRPARLFVLKAFIIVVPMVCVLLVAIFS